MAFTPRLLHLATFRAMKLRSRSAPSVRKQAAVLAAWSMRFDPLIYLYLLFEVFYLSSGSPSGTLGSFLVILVWIAPPLMFIRFIFALRKHFDELTSKESEQNDNQ
jgi:hypothetical protein